MSARLLIPALPRRLMLASVNRLAAQSAHLLREMQRAQDQPERSAFYLRLAASLNERAGRRGEKIHIASLIENRRGRIRRD